MGKKMCLLLALQLFTLQWYFGTTFEIKVLFASSDHTVENNPHFRAVVILLEINDKWKVEGRYMTYGC